ncbi:hypothetical protein ES703_53220 [subsurface metagenome]
MKEDSSPYRYARAGEDLQPEVLVEPGLPDEDRFILASSRRFADTLYGKVVATVGDPTDKSGILGWPVVEVKKGYYFWVREMPVGAKFIKEEST